jgi:hypothetical protein
MQKRPHTSPVPFETLCGLCRGELVHSVTAENWAKSPSNGDQKLARFVCWILLEAVFWTLELLAAVVIG